MKEKLDYPIVSHIFAALFFFIMFVLVISVAVMICMMSWYLISTIWGAI